MPARCTFVFVLLTAGVLAQLGPGDVGVTWHSTSQFAVLRAAGGSTVFNVGAFQGASTASTILLDPQVPDAFLVAGSGFVGRAVITGPGTVAYSVLTPATARPTQMSWDGGTLVLIDFDSDQVLRLDPSSGAVTNITAGAQPWGSDLRSGAVDPATGRIFAGGNNGLWVIPPGSGVPAPYASGWAAGMSFVSGVAIDRLTFEPVATLLTVNRVVRIDSAGNLVDLVSPGSIPGPNGLDVDANGDFIVGASFGEIHRVPRAGVAAGTPTLIGTASGVLGAANGVASVQGLFRVFLTPAGSGGATLAFSGIPAGTVEGWTFPTLDVSLPPGAGPVFGVVPDALSLLVLTSFPAAQPGFVLHWSWSVSPPVFPASPAALPAGTFPPGLALDLLGVAVDPALTLTVTPPRRVFIS